MLYLHRNCFVNILYALNSVRLLTNAPILCLNVLGIYGRSNLKPYVWMYVCMYTCTVVRSDSDQGAVPIKIRGVVPAQTLCLVQSPFSGQ